jgi:hypothetical protein
MKEEEQPFSAQSVLKLACRKLVYLNPAWRHTLWMLASALDREYLNVFAFIPDIKLQSSQRTRSESECMRSLPEVLTVYFAV